MRDTRAGHKPSPPEGRGPVLAWHKESKTGKVMIFVGSVVLLAVLGGGAVMIDGGDPIRALTFWPGWLILIVASLAIASPLTYTTLSAGADWFQVENVRFGMTVKRGHINLYELTKISATVGAEGAALILELRDDRNIISLEQEEWHSDRRMWDLVYNGILHSVAAGAEVNTNARGMLKLDRVFQDAADGPPILTNEITDDQVYDLMDDASISHTLDVINFDGDADAFRRKFPEIMRDMLANPHLPWLRGDNATR